MEQYFQRELTQQLKDKRTAAGKQYLCMMFETFPSLVPTLNVDLGDTTQRSIESPFIFSRPTLIVSTESHERWINHMDAFVDSLEEYRMPGRTGWSPSWHIPDYLSSASQPLDFYKLELTSWAHIGHLYKFCFQVMLHGALCRSSLSMFLKFPHPRLWPLVLENRLNGKVLSKKKCEVPNLMMSCKPPSLRTSNIKSVRVEINSFIHLTSSGLLNSQGCKQERLIAIKSVSSLDP